MTVYADVLFLVNFSLDYVSLYITGRLLSQPMRAWRLGAAAALGACYAVSALFFDLPEAVYIAVTLAVSGVMCVCAFRRCGVIGYIGSGILLFSVGCALGGAMTAVYSLGAGYKDSLSGGTDDTGVGVMVFVAVIATAVVAAGGRVLRRRRGVSSASVRIEIGERSVELSALPDSGNLLRDPVSGRPALVVSTEAAQTLLPPEIAALAESDDIASSASNLPAESLRRVRILPVSNVYGEGLVVGYRPDRVTVSLSRGGSAGSKRDVDCILALSNKRGGFGGCDAVLPAELS